MTLRDARGLATSSANRRSLDAFEVALGQFQCYRGNSIATIDAALAADSEFAFGQIFRAEVHISAWEASVLPEVETSLRALEKLGNKCNDRERAHVAAIRDWHVGDWDGFRARFDLLLAEHPRDALALQIGHLADFFHGDRDNLRGRMMRALPAWNRELPGYGFTLGMQAFGLEECGDYRRAEETARHAIELEPDDCWAHHALAHVLEMEARQVEGIALMESRRDHWAQEDNGFAFHNWWHTALYNLDQDRADRALEIYDRSIRPGQSEIQTEMLDATALLWRVHLRGIDVGKRWHDLAAAYDKTAQDGFYAFNDMHAMIAYVATGRCEAAKRLLAGATRAAEKSGANARMEREAGLPIMRAVEAFGRGQYDTAVELLMPVRYRAHVFGGSHAQRDIIHRTLIEAALRDGQFALANALATERTQLKPDCPFSWQLRNRAEAGIAGRGGVAMPPR
ncbi:MAG: tetratricopeptide repeat protein [Dongiaceae bacterium]